MIGSQYTCLGPSSLSPFSFSSSVSSSSSFLLLKLYFPIKYILIKVSLFLPVPLHLYSCLDPVLFFLIRKEQASRRQHDEINKIRWSKNHQAYRRKRHPKLAKWTRDPLIHMLRSPIAILSWNPQCIWRRHGGDLGRPCAYRFHFCEFIWDQFNWLRGPCSPGILYSFLFLCFSASSSVGFHLITFKNWMNHLLNCIHSSIIYNIHYS